MNERIPPIPFSRGRDGLHIRIWIVIFSLFSVTAVARLELWIVRPVEKFTTNNKELIVEGIVRCPEGQSVAVLVNTPAGISDLDSLEESLQSLTVDLGSPHTLTAMVLSPVFDDDRSLGPRVVNLSFSKDGQRFEDKGIFNCTSGMDPKYGEARVEFGNAIKARFVRIDMIDGWQADRIGIKEVGFVDDDGELAVALDLDEYGEAYFLMTILLKAGDNAISIIATSLDLDEDMGEIAEESRHIAATYMPEVILEEEPLILSDGYKAELTIPVGALGTEIKKIGIHSLNMNQIGWMPYSDNMRIARGTSPVLAYEVELSAVIPFPATAKDSLDRQPPGLAVDGNPEYPSTWMTTLSALPIWFKIDLRESRTIGMVAITARVENDASYGPEKLTISVSDSDNEVDYREVAARDECDDKRTEIALLTMPTARYVRIDIEEGKQGNNIQINEVEFIDDEGAKIVSYLRLSSVALERPVELTLLYDDYDLNAAGVQMEGNLAIFSWNDGMKEWGMVGGKVDSANNWIAVNLNHFSTFALFEAVLSTAEVRWSYNPFSPNGDGIADTTTIFISLDAEAGERARVEIFDYTGKLVRTLLHEEIQSGHVSIVWDGNDENGDPVSIGPYIYQVVMGKEVRNGILVVAR